MIRMYSVKDVKTGSFMNPFNGQDHVQAQRCLQVAVNDENVHLHHFPEDFELHFVGEFNQSTGKFTSPETPEFICQALSLVKWKTADLNTAKPVSLKDVKNG